MSALPTLRAEARLLVRSGLALWFLSGLSMIWEVLAMQGPDSPMRVGILAGPIAQLRGYCFALGGALFAAAWLWPHLYEERRGRGTLGILLTGVSVHVLALVYAASHGMVGVQAFDPRPDARWLLLTRALGHGLCLIALGLVGLRAAKR